MRLILTIAASVVLASCAGLDPVIDLAASTSPENSQADTEYCQWLAQDSIEKNYAMNVGGGALLGAGLGAAYVVTSPTPTHASGEAAAVAAIMGALVGLFVTELDHSVESQALIKQCLEDRGYHILTWR
jgi:hypothetical protein